MQNVLRGSLTTGAVSFKRVLGCNLNGTLNIRILTQDAPGVHRSWRGTLVHDVIEEAHLSLERLSSLSIQTIRDSTKTV